ncbi:MAG: hypothetical protein J5892_01370 [Bacilli bacterium]|nr:hypothetical protein [Bacilli bacterium]
MAKKVYKNLDESINKEMNDDDIMVFKYDQSKYEIKEFNNNHDDRSLIEIRNTELPFAITSFLVPDGFKAIIQLSKIKTDEFDTFVVINSKNILGIKINPKKFNSVSFDYDYHFKDRIPSYSYISDNIYLIKQSNIYTDAIYKDIYSSSCSDTILTITDNPECITETITLDSLIYYNPEIAKLLGDKSVILSKKTWGSCFKDAIIPEFDLIYGLNIEDIDKKIEPTFVTDCYYSTLNKRYQILDYDAYKKQFITSPGKYINALIGKEIKEYYDNYSDVEEFLKFGKSDNLIHSLGSNKKS